MDTAESEARFTREFFGRKSRTFDAVMERSMNYIEVSPLISSPARVRACVRACVCVCACVCVLSNWVSTLARVVLFRPQPHPQFSLTPRPPHPLPLSHCQLVGSPGQLSFVVARLYCDPYLHRHHSSGPASHAGTWVCLFACFVCLFV